MPDVIKMYARIPENITALIANPKYKYKYKCCLLSSSHQFYIWMFENTDNAVQHDIQNIIDKTNNVPPFKRRYYLYTYSFTYPFL
jgi:hypothetical protein